MRDLSPFNFGLIIAYLVPGFVALWGTSYHSPTVRGWLAAVPQTAPSVGGLLYATLAAVAAGVILSAFRWALIEPLHHRTGVRPPDWDFTRLDRSLPAYQAMVEQHFRYHQFCANMVIALVFAYFARMAAVSVSAYQWGWLDLGCAMIVIVLFAGSRDALAKYYQRAGAVLVSPTPNPKEDRHERWPEGSPVRTEECGGEDRRCCEAEQHSAVEAGVRGQSADEVVPAGEAG
jgi:hypothetical protein